MRAPTATSEYNDSFGPRAPRTPELFSLSRKELMRSSSSQLSARKELLLNSSSTQLSSRRHRHTSSTNIKHSRQRPSSRTLLELEGFHDAAPMIQAPRDIWKPSPRFHHHGGTEMPRRAGPVQEHGMETIDPSFAGLNAPPPPLGWFHSENYGRFGSDLAGEVRPWGSLSAANQRESAASLISSPAVLYRDFSRTKSAVYTIGPSSTPRNAQVLLDAARLTPRYADEMSNIRATLNSARSLRSARQQSPLKGSTSMGALLLQNKNIRLPSNRPHGVNRGTGDQCFEHAFE